MPPSLGCSGDAPRFSSYNERGTGRARAALPPPPSCTYTRSFPGRSCGPFFPRFVPAGALGARRLVPASLLPCRVHLCSVRARAHAHDRFAGPPPDAFRPPPSSRCALFLAVRPVSLCRTVIFHLSRCPHLASRSATTRPISPLSHPPRASPAPLAASPRATSERLHAPTRASFLSPVPFRPLPPTRPAGRVGTPLFLGARAEARAACPTVRTDGRPSGGAELCRWPLVFPNRFPFPPVSHVAFALARRPADVPERRGNGRL